MGWGAGGREDADYPDPAADTRLDPDGMGRPARPGSRRSPNDGRPTPAPEHLFALGHDRGEARVAAPRIRDAAGGRWWAAGGSECASLLSRPYCTGGPDSVRAASVTEALERIASTFAL